MAIRLNSVLAFRAVNLREILINLNIPTIYGQKAKLSGFRARKWDFGIRIQDTNMRKLFPLNGIKLG
jgi:hypothetical protein